MGILTKSTDQIIFSHDRRKYFPQEQAQQGPGEPFAVLAVDAADVVRRVPGQLLPTVAAAVMSRSCSRSEAK